jgi:hypothetical protein
MNTLISCLGEKLSASQEGLSFPELVKICHRTFAVDGLASASSGGHRFKTRPETCHRKRNVYESLQECRTSRNIKFANTSFENV